jgi:hypothetical protein
MALHADIEMEGIRVGLLEDGCLFQSKRVAALKQTVHLGGNKLVCIRQLHAKRTRLNTITLSYHNYFTTVSSCFLEFSH